MVLVLLVKIEMTFWFDGQQTQGTINNKSTHVERGHKGGARISHIVSYEFHDSSGKLRQGDEAIDRESWNATQVGDALTVTYVARDPRQNRPAQHGSIVPAFVIQALLVLIGGALVFGGAAMLVFGIRELARKVRLIETGEPAAGLIDRVEPVVHRSRTPRAFDCTYHYLVPAWVGVPSQIKQGTITLNPQQAKHMQPGGLLLVVFDPERPAEHTVDIYKARHEEPGTLLPTPRNLRP